MRVVKHKGPYFLLASLIVATAIFVTVTPPMFVDYLESKTFDIRTLLRGERSVRPDIVIVAIDDKTLEQFALNVWTRGYMATLIDKLTSMQPKVIGIDYLYQLPEVSKGLESLRELNRSYQRLASVDKNFLGELQAMEQINNVDASLIAAVNKAGNVVLAFAPHVFEAMASIDSKANVQLPGYMTWHAFMLSKPGPAYKPVLAQTALTPFEGLAEVAAAIGHVYSLYDQDGAIRWEPLYVKMGADIYPSFGLEIARKFKGLRQQDVKVITGDRIIMGEKIDLPTDISGRILINYPGKRGKFTTYSAIDILADTIPATELQGKIVLVGATALGTGDIHVTPFTELAGVEKQATVVENILSLNYLVKEELTTLIDIVAIICFAFIMALVVPYFGAFASGLFFGFLLIVYLGLTQYAFVAHNIWVHVVVPALTLSILYTTLTTYRFFTEERLARQIRNTFSKYTTEKIVTELIDHPEMAKLGGARKNITVLFSDVRSFTTFSENHEPEEVVEALNEFLSAMTEVIMAWDGTLDKFVGDEIMAFWGAPVAQKNHAELAVGCALAMMRRLHELQIKWRTEGRAVLGIGIGINTGEMVVGNIGSEKMKMDYTVIGDAVNLGARVEALTRNYDTDIIITEFTLNQIRKLLSRSENPEISSHLQVTKLDEVKVKGKENAVVIYALSEIE
ncbi:adenylate/guanylate cyclase domain-containing protein [Mariprofundus sp. KV]|uniref:CHASE2 domain-containing protein n=1 Tax=Mariprofundus sp. KV TaxID=2608715 RepID=UPI0015A34069|nr:adenylate/guanylate cyclase domain-containing protein [Mariprofundus sp. KV]NWF35276.1 adenylate/guanylate cyclase domain-containing protein [Mariprofundus sp. KV]